MISDRRPRNHLIDAARALSIGIVVAFHGLLYQVRLVEGRPALVPWSAPTWFYPVTWVFLIIPVFFVAGGFAHALIVDRMQREGSSYGHYLASRGRRLVGPLLSFVTFCAVAATAAAWLGFLREAVDLSRSLMQLLWFLTVYLVIVGVAPLMVRLHDRYGWAVMAMLGVAVALVDAWSFAGGVYEVRNLNLFLLWPLVHQLGIAYHRGWFRSGPAWQPWTAVGGGVLGIAVLVFVFGYPATSVGFADVPIANLQPPTLAMAFLAVAQCGVLGLLERSGALATISGRAQKRLAVANALTMTVYLWHIGCIGLAALGLLALSWAWPAAAGVLLAQPVVAALSLVVVGVVVPAIGRVDLRLIPPLGERQDLGGAVLAYGVLAAGTALVWQSGTVLHPHAPASTLGVLLVWGGAWLMRRASARPDRLALAQ